MYMQINKYIYIYIYTYIHLTYYDTKATPSLDQTLKAMTMEKIRDFNKQHKDRSITYNTTASTTRERSPRRAVGEIPSRNTKTTIQLIQPEPERYFFVVEWSAGCPVCFVCCVFLEGFCVCFVVILCVCFCLVFLSVCLNTTQYTTPNTNKLEMGLFMTCVKCSKYSNSFQVI